MLIGVLLNDCRLGNILVDFTQRRLTLTDFHIALFTETMDSAQLKKHKVQESWILRCLVFGDHWMKENFPDNDKELSRLLD